MKDKLIEIWANNVHGTIPAEVAKVHEIQLMNAEKTPLQRVHCDLFNALLQGASSESAIDLAVMSTLRNLEDSGREIVIVAEPHQRIPRGIPSQWRVTSQLDEEFALMQRSKDVIPKFELLITSRVNPTDYAVHISVVAPIALRLEPAYA